MDSMALASYFAFAFALLYHGPYEGDLTRPRDDRQMQNRTPTSQYGDTEDY
jgi:hypothetical protein